MPARPPLGEELLLVVARRALLRGSASIGRDELLDAARAEHDVALDGPLAPLEPALEALVTRGALRLVDDRIGVDAEAAETIATVERERTCRSFDDWMLRCEASAASRELCRRSTNLPFIQFGTVDDEQRTAMLRALDARPGARIVDLGCGLGTFAEDVSDTTGAHVTGLDFAPRAIARATERTGAKRDRLTFRTGDLDHLDLAPGAFDAALAIDTLYFVADLPCTLRDVAGALAAGGRLVAFYDAILREGDSPSVLEPDESRLALALRAAGLRFTTTDFTERDRTFWKAQREAIDELKDAWEREGNASLWQSADREARVMGGHHEAGRVRRHLYVATR